MLTLKQRFSYGGAGSKEPDFFRVFRRESRLFLVITGTASVRARHTFLRFPLLKSWIKQSRIASNQLPGTFQLTDIKSGCLVFFRKEHWSYQPTTEQQYVKYNLSVWSSISPHCAIPRYSDVIIRYSRGGERGRGNPQRGWDLAWILQHLTCNILI